MRFFIVNFGMRCAESTGERAATGSSRRSQICGDGMPRLRRTQELDPGRFVVSDYESARDPAFESTKFFRIPLVLSAGAKVPDLRTSGLCSFDRHSDECLR